MRIDIIDGIRGHLLIGMVVAHLSFQPGVQVLRYFHHNLVLGLYDAEFFVPIAGLLIGVMMSARMNTTSACLKFVSKRLATIYKYYLLSAVPFVLSAVSLDMARNGWLAVDIATMQNGGMYSDILPMYFYCFLMLGACLAAMGLRPGRWLALSAGIYGLAKVTPYQGFFGFSDSFITFNIGAWQLLFFLSIFLGFHHRAILGWIQRQSSAAGIASLIGIASGVLLLRGFAGFDYERFISYAIETNTRFQMHPVHLLHVLLTWAMFTLVLTAKSAPLAWCGHVLRAYFNLRPIATIGKYSIQMFVFHVFLMALFKSAAPHLSQSGCTTLALVMIAVFIAAPNIVRLIDGSRKRSVAALQSA